MSWDSGRDVLDLEKLYARKPWADFSHPSFCEVRGLQIVFLHGHLRLSLRSPPDGDNPPAQATGVLRS